MASIKLSTPEDLDRIADCYIPAFRDSFTCKLGKRYVMKTLEWYLAKSNCFLFHLEENHKCLGFCGGMIRDGTQRVGSSSGIFEYSLRVGLQSVATRPWLIFHPVIIKKFKFILGNIRRIALSKRQVPKNSTVPGNIEKEAGLIVIGVDPGNQGKGYGTLLLKEFERRCRDFKINRMRLSVKVGNHLAMRSYQKNGWNEDSKDAEMIYMIKILD